VDYAIWGLLQQCVYIEFIRKLEEFKQQLVNIWANVKQSVVDNAIEQLLQRLPACIRQDDNSSIYFDDIG